ncbi:hypothetical protein OsJ_18024 [Oryza sativa Japonica Group]|uniref:Uncharacterized protein n=1 Tax=Oryza sativa subsp. japonica TaxID=39947 RepID=B9FKG0_ORYSJ|nr:hypothetical protein OsJ_18024 [Oryza sativa Japonica Group]
MDAAFESSFPAAVASKSLFPVAAASIQAATGGGPQSRAAIDFASAQGPRLKSRHWRRNTAAGRRRNTAAGGEERNTVAAQKRM